MGISLCMIAGNEQDKIERVLDSVHPLADEVCLVAAVGEQEEDETSKRAGKWCMRNRVRFIPAAYRNKVPMPHVDDFSAARQLSFDCASNDWCLWLDCDDLLRSQDLKAIYNHANQGGPTGYRYRYQIDPTRGDLMRERLVLRQSGKWVGKVHERFQANSVLADEPDVCVIHSPDRTTAKRRGSSERNLRILKTIEDKTPREWFYFQDEVFHAVGGEEAYRTSLEALLHYTPAMLDERYDTLLNLGDARRSEGFRWFSEALHLMPWRREALAYLVQHSIACGLLSHAVSYWRMMDNLPRPKPLPWMHRECWHTWGRNYLRVLILKASGHPEQARTEHDGYMLDPEYADEYRRLIADKPERELFHEEHAH